MVTKPKTIEKKPTAEKNKKDLKTNLKLATNLSHPVKKDTESSTRLQHTCYRKSNTKAKLRFVNSSENMTKKAAR